MLKTPLRTILPNANHLRPHRSNVNVKNTSAGHSEDHEKEMLKHRSTSSHFAVNKFAFPSDINW